MLIIRYRVRSSAEYSYNEYCKSIVKVAFYWRKFAAGHRGASGKSGSGGGGDCTVVDEEVEDYSHQQRHQLPQSTTATISNHLQHQQQHHWVHQSVMMGVLRWRDNSSNIRSGSSNSSSSSNNNNQLTGTLNRHSIEVGFR